MINSLSSVDRLPGLAARGDFHQQRVTVMGLGTFGGGLGAVRFLAERGARLTVTDLRSEGVLKDSLQQLADLTDIKFVLGRHEPADFTQADLLVVNPAVAPGNEFVALAQRAGVPLTTEMSLFWERQLGRVVAITGSNGKSTTTALTHALLAATGRRCWLGGNIGKSLLSVVDEITPEDWVVLELSSFQLEWLDRIQARPDIAIVTNFSPNHLDWHQTLDNYRHAKQTLLRWQTARGVAVLNADDPDVASWATAAQRVYFGASVDCESRIIDSELVLTERLSDIGAAFRDARGGHHVAQQGSFSVNLAEHFSVPGIHNRMNAAAAVAAATLAGATREQLIAGLRTFQSLPHRLQLVAERFGRAFYNDSIATTPESAICGLQSFDRPIVLLAGGYDKQVDLTEFARAIAQRVKAVALMGQTATALGTAINTELAEPSHHSSSRQVAMRIATDFDDAFDWATSQANAGDVVLLSPGCASYDWFRNFIDRGDQFTARANVWLPH